MSLRVGVIGTGMIGQDHIRRLTKVLPGCTITAVSDVDGDRAAKIAAGLGAQVFPTGEALIASGDVEALVVTSTGATHAPYVLAAIAAGKPVFCEKPLATTQADCRAIMAAEVAHGKRLVQVGFMRRFDAGYRAMKRVIAAGKIGAPLLFHSVHRNASVPPGYSNDMMLNDTCVHDIDIARFLIEDEVAAVTVKAARHSGNTRPDLADPTLVLLEMAGGALVDIEISVFIGYGYDIRGEVSGETGTVSLAETSPVIVKSAGQYAGEIGADWRERFIDAYDEELRAWLFAAAEGTATGPSVWDGYAATAVTDAALAARTTGEWQAIAMAEKPGLYQ